MEKKGKRRKWSSERERERETCKVGLEKWIEGKFKTTGKQE